jgi:hypothetical protein
MTWALRDGPSDKCLSSTWAKVPSPAELAAIQAAENSEKARTEAARKTAEEAARKAQDEEAARLSLIDRSYTVANGCPVTMATLPLVTRRRILFNHVADIRLLTGIAFAGIPAPQSQPISLSQAFSG